MHTRRFMASGHIYIYKYYIYIHIHIFIYVFIPKNKTNIFCNTSQAKQTFHPFFSTPFCWVFVTTSGRWGGLGTVRPVGCLAETRKRQVVGPRKIMGKPHGLIHPEIFFEWIFFIGYKGWVFIPYDRCGGWTNFFFRKHTVWQVKMASSFPRFGVKMVIVLARDHQTVQKKQKNAIIEEVEEPETTKIAMQNPSIAATPKVRELPRNPVRGEHPAFYYYRKNLKC